MTQTAAPVVFPAQRAIEHAASVAGVSPLRYFRVLWPLWQVEITGTVDEPQAYEVLDRFVTRAIGHAQLDTAAQIADFLGLAPPLVRECLRYLALIGHVTERAGVLVLTDRGQRSLQEDKRFVVKEFRQLLLFDQFSGAALPRGHYADNVVVVNRPWLEKTECVDRARFTPLFGGSEYREEIVHKLVADPGRSEHNLPTRVTGIRILGKTDVYLPAYLVQTTGGFLAYTRAGEERDAFVEDVCRRFVTIADLAHESFEDTREFWADWVEKVGKGWGSLHQARNGVRRCTLPAAAHGRKDGLAIHRIGSFEVRGDYFLQIWCDDAAVRRKAVLDRAARMILRRRTDSRAKFDAHVAKLAARLEVPPPDVTAIRDYADRADLPDATSRLDQLT